MVKTRKSYSNYTLSRRRQTTSKGDIFERDWMTVSELDGFAPGTMPVYASGNFKMTVPSERTTRKQYSFSNWVLNDSGSTEWTLDSIDEENIIFKKNLINPNYSSILDFAYYGSAVDLIRATVNDLIFRYPAEIYTANRTIPYVTTGGTYAVLTGVAENPFLIDVSTDFIKREKAENEYRYMCLSYDKYEIIEGDAESGTPVETWSSGSIQKKDCLVNGDVVFTGANVGGISFDGVYIDGKIYLTTSETDKHIRLQKKYIDEVFDSFDDFERVLLNRNSKPKYRAMLYTPRETETGVVTSKVSYTWPTISGDWNLEVEGDSYVSYLNGLLDIATYYDEYRSDNLWRSYTHESIKNFDWTTPRDTYVPEIDGDLIDTERMEAIIKVCGRQFDDIKRYLENIKYTVNVSYDSKNNTPKANLSQMLEMSGWEVKNIIPDGAEYFELDYPGQLIKCRPEDVNDEFFRRMILNSRNILSKKGTRAGIEAMYSLFGLQEKRFGDEFYYTIDEYIATAGKYISGSPEDEESEYLKVLDFNSKKDGFYDDYTRTTDELCGLAAAHKFNIDEVEYLVPWYDRGEIYDGGVYYQMFGGWGKRERKTIVSEIAPEISEIESDENLSIYDETVKNIRVADDFGVLNGTPIGFLSNGDIFYVLDIKEACDVMGGDSTSYTHYVLFTNEMNNNGKYIPYNDEFSWFLIPVSDFEGDELPWYAKKVLYLESIHDNSKGNNPHNGNGKYDGGSSYFDFYNQLFYGTFAEDKFTEYENNIRVENARRHYENRFVTEKLPDLSGETDTIREIGFNVTTGTTDNQKIWYFLSEDDGLYNEDTQILSTREFDWKTPNDNPNEFEKVTNENFGLEIPERKDVQNKPICQSGCTTSLTFNEMSLDIPDEIKNYYADGPDDTWSYSVLNTKNIKITYHLPWELEDYVTNVVEFYVKQLIPSTAIVEFVWEYSDGERPKFENRPTLSLYPSRQTLRSFETEAEIDIISSNVDWIGIDEESTETR